MVVEQLSLSDFQEIAMFSLPANLNNCDKKVLTGKYCLQVFCNDILSEMSYESYPVSLCYPIIVYFFNTIV